MQHGITRNMLVKLARDAGVLEKLAIRFRGFHGTNGAWERLIPRYGGTNAVHEANPSAVFATPHSRKELQGALGYAKRTTLERGGHPHVARLTLDTARGWYPSGISDVGKRALTEEGAESVGEMRQMIQEKAHDMDELRARIRAAAASPARDELKRALGQHHRELNTWVGSWAHATEVPTPLSRWRRLIGSTNRLGRAEQITRSGAAT